MFGVRHSVTLSFKLSGSLPLRAVDLSGAVNSGCSDEAALRLTDREEMRVCREQRKKHHLYIGRGRMGGEKKVKTEPNGGPEVRLRLRFKNSSN